MENEKIISQLASDYEVGDNQIGQWRKQFLEEIPRIFSDRRKRPEKEGGQLTSEL
jgi:transposase-like protein